MKKLFTLAVAALFCTAAGAQVVSASSYTKAKSKTVWYVKAGLNFSGMGGEGTDDFSSITGYNLGIGFDKPIGTSGVFWSSGLSLATKGFKYEYDDYGYDYEMKLNVNKLEIPLTFGYKYSINDDWAVDARFGGFVNYDLWGKYTVKDDDEEYEVKIGDMDDYDKVGAGLLIGIGGWWQSLNLSLTYEFGLLKQNEMKEHNLMLSVAYAF